MIVYCLSVNDAEDQAVAQKGTNQTNVFKCKEHRTPCGGLERDQLYRLMSSNVRTIEPYDLHVQ